MFYFTVIKLYLIVKNVTYLIFIHAEGQKMFQRTTNCQKPLYSFYNEKDDHIDTVCHRERESERQTFFLTKWLKSVKYNKI